MVAALKYLRKRNKDFASRPIEELFALVNDAFDILNSRSTNHKGSKSPLRHENVEAKLAQLRKLCDFLRHLKLADGKLVSKSPRKQAVLGFLIATMSLEGLYKTYLKDYPYFLTYRLSQDHIELCFNTIRRNGGWNNNPTALQLRGAFRCILLGAGCHSARSGNALPLQLDDTPFPEPLTSDDVRQCDLHGSIDSWQLTEYVEDVVTYGAGWVIRKAEEQIKCSVCIDSLRKVSTQSCRTTLISLKITVD